jgi:hypothetical protein
MAKLWPATDSILTHWRDRQESAWNSSSLMVWHLRANSLTSILEVSTSNMGRIIVYFIIPWLDCSRNVKSGSDLATGYGCFCFLQHTIFIRGSASSLSSFWDHTHLDTSHSIELLWTSDQADAKTSTWQHTTLTTGIHAPRGIRTRNPSKRAAADPRCRPRGHGHRLATFLPTYSSRMCHTVYLNDLEIQYI